VEIGLPDEKGRIQILNIHTLKMRTNGYLDKDVSIEELATLTKNFTGAEIEGLVRSATSFALNRQIDPKNPTKPIDPDSVTVCREDFINALDEVKPAFGVSESKLDDNIKNGIISFSNEFQKLYNTGLEFIDQVKNSTRTPILSFLLEGEPGTGKTALACELAKNGEFPLVKFLTPEDFVGFSEQTKVNKISKCFYDAYKSPVGCIIIDDIERFLDYVSLGNRFSNQVLQTLLVLFRQNPPKNHRLLIIGTTSKRQVLEEMGLLDAFSFKLETPCVKGDQIKKVLEELKYDTDIDVDKIHVPIKKLIYFAEMSAFGKDGTFNSRLTRCLQDFDKTLFPN